MELFLRHPAAACRPIAPRPPSPPARGFTLIEAIVTLIIVGILAVVALPRFNLLRGFDEVGYRDKVRATLEFARKSAVAQRRSVCVQVAGNGMTLTIANNTPENPTGTCTAGAGYPRNLPLVVPDRACGGAANRICAPANATATLTLGGGASGAFSFDALGRPSAAANLVVTGEAAHPIVVEAETGYVH